LHQAGAARVRFPKPGAGAPPEAVLQHGGGLTGGDRMDLEVTLGARAEATLTTAAAEKIYRARDSEASEIRVSWHSRRAPPRLAAAGDHPVDGSRSTGAPRCGWRRWPLSSLWNR